MSIGRIPAIIGGVGTLSSLPGHIAELGGTRSALVVIDPGLKTHGYVERISTLLARANMSALMIVLPPGEPKEETVRDVVTQARKSTVACAVCIGGGSAIDTGKLIASLTLEGNDVAEYRLAAKALPLQRLPLICVPTTAGTGAEATSVSVLSSDEGVKYWFWGASLKPDLVLHDPEITVGLPPGFTAATGIDAMVHAIEAATNLNATPTNSMFAYRAIELVSRHLATAVREPGNLEARARMLEAATLAGIAIDNAGTAIAHNIAHGLGSLAPVPHGRAVAIGMCATLAWNVEGNPDIYQPVAKAMSLAGGAQALPGAFEQFVRSIDIDLDVRQYGLTAAQLAEQMVQPENIAMLKSNRRTVADSDLLMHAGNVLALKNQVQRS